MFFFVFGSVREIKLALPPVVHANIPSRIVSYHDCRRHLANVNEAASESTRSATSSPVTDGHKARLIMTSRRFISARRRRQVSTSVEDCLNDSVHSQLRHHVTFLLQTIQHRLNIEHNQTLPATPSTHADTGSKQPPLFNKLVS